jgi:isopenicillin N synthase-like dioxygenase
MTAVKHAFTELPTIDIRDLAGDDLARRQAVADAIGRAAREVGFFYITGHGIDPALIAGVRRRRSRSSPCRWRKDELLHRPLQKP